MAVSAAQIAAAAAEDVRNARILAAVCDQYAYPYAFALAIMEKESGGAGTRGGRNVYGHDVGGALAGFEEDCNAGNYAVFRWLIDVQGMKSNGVGPMQITWPPYFPMMAAMALDPWRVRDSLAFGVGKILAPALAKQRAKGLTLERAFWQTARDYNGRDAYGDDAVAKAKAWLRTVGNTDAPAVKL